MKKMSVIIIVSFIFAALTACGGDILNNGIDSPDKETKLIWGSSNWGEAEWGK